MLQQRCEFEQRILFKVAFPPDRNFPPSPTRGHGSVMISMQARARFEKIGQHNCCHGFILGPFHILSSLSPLPEC